MALIKCCTRPSLGSVTMCTGQASTQKYSVWSDSVYQNVENLIRDLQCYDTNAARPWDPEFYREPNPDGTRTNCDGLECIIPPLGLLRGGEVPANGNPFDNGLRQAAYLGVGSIFTAPNGLHQIVQEKMCPRGGLSLAGDTSLGVYSEGPAYLKSISVDSIKRVKLQTCETPVYKYELSLNFVPYKNDFIPEGETFCAPWCWCPKMTAVPVQNERPLRMGVFLGYFEQGAVSTNCGSQHGCRSEEYCEPAEAVLEQNNGIQHLHALGNMTPDPLCFNIQRGVCRRITNSLNEDVEDNFPVIYEYDTEFTLTTYWPDDIVFRILPGAVLSTPAEYLDCYLGTTNEEEFTAVIPCVSTYYQDQDTPPTRLPAIQGGPGTLLFSGYTIASKKHECLGPIRNPATGQSHSYDNVPTRKLNYRYLEISMTFMYRACSWDEDFRNTSRNRGACVGMPNGHGEDGVFTDDDYGLLSAAPVTPIRAAGSGNSFVTTTPQMIDPTTQQPAKNDEQFYMRYRLFPQTNWNTLRFHVVCCDDEPSGISLNPPNSPPGIEV